MNSPLGLISVTSIIYIAIESISQILRYVAQMGVEIVHSAAVRKLAGVGMALIGSADGDRIGTRQFAVDMIIGRGACEEVDFERFAFFMELFGTLCKSHSYNFGSSRGGKARESHIVSVFNVAGSFFCRNKRDTHL